MVGGDHIERRQQKNVRQVVRFIPFQRLEIHAIESSVTPVERDPMISQISREAAARVVP